MRRRKLTKGTLSSIIILFIIICIIAILISAISSIFTFLSNYRDELIMIGIAILSIFIVVKLIGNLTKNNEEEILKRLHIGNLYITNKRFILKTDKETKNINWNDIINISGGIDFLQINKIKGKSVSLGTMDKIDIFKICFFYTLLRK